MLTCVPQSLCSWDYRILGASAGSAALTFYFLTEQGTISLGGAEHSVRKHGWLSGHWTLECDGDIYADAEKPSAMFRSFEIRTSEMKLTIKAQSAFTRAYEILAGGSVVGTIRPVHTFTRRAFIECSSSVPELAQLFSFWLVVLTWRRAANNNSAATSTP
jgi:hypothetical protein